MGLSKHLKFQAYYQKYLTRIYNYIYFRTGQNKELAEDLSQEVFIQALEHFDSFDERVQFSTWIYTIAKNKIIDQYRKKHKYTVDIEELSNSREISVEAQDSFVFDFDKNLQLDQIKQGLGKLSPHYQEIITLKYINDLHTDEICQILKKDANTVRVNLHRALKHLSATLKPNT